MALKLGAPEQPILKLGDPEPKSKNIFSREELTKAFQATISPEQFLPQPIQEAQTAGLLGLGTGLTGINPPERDKELMAKYPITSIPGKLVGGVAPYFGGPLSAAAKFTLIPAAREVARQATTQENLTPLQRTFKVGTAALYGRLTAHFFDQAGILNKVLPKAWVTPPIEKILKTAATRIVARGAVMAGTGTAESVVQKGISEPTVPSTMEELLPVAAFNFAIGTVLGTAVEIPALSGAVWTEGKRIAKSKGVETPKTYPEAKELVKSIGQNPEELSPIYRDAVYRWKYAQALKEIKAKYQPGIVNELLPLRKSLKEFLTDKSIQINEAKFDSVSEKERWFLNQKAKAISKRSGWDWVNQRPKITFEQAWDDLKNSSFYLKLLPYRDLISRGADPVDIYMAVNEAEKLKTPVGVYEAITTKQGKKPLTEFFKPTRKLEELPAIQEQAGISKGIVHISEGTGLRTIEIPGYSGWVREESIRILTDTTKTLGLKDAKGKDIEFNQLPAVFQAEANAEIQKVLMSEGTEEQKQQAAKDILQDKLQANNIYFVGSERPISGDTPVFTSLLTRSMPIKELVDKLKHGVEYPLNGIMVRESIRPDQWSIHVGQLEAQRPGLAEKLRAMIKQLYDESTIPEAIPPTPLGTEPVAPPSLTPQGEDDHVILEEVKQLDKRTPLQKLFKQKEEVVISHGRPVHIKTAQTIKDFFNKSVTLKGDDNYIPHFIGNKQGEVKKVFLTDDEKLILKKNQYADLVNHNYEITGESVIKFSTDELAVEDKIIADDYYERYGLPGGENYRNILFVLPNLNVYTHAWGAIKGNFGWARVKDYRDTKGQKILFIIELQHVLPKIDTKAIEPDEDEPTMHPLLREEDMDTLPSFAKGNKFYDFAIRRMLRLAVDQGYAGIAWQNSDDVKKYVGMGREGDTKFSVGNELRLEENGIPDDAKNITLSLAPQSLEPIFRISYDTRVTNLYTQSLSPVKGTWGGQDESTVTSTVMGNDSVKDLLIKLNESPSNILTLTLEQAKKFDWQKRIVSDVGNEVSNLISYHFHSLQQDIEHGGPQKARDVLYFDLHAAGVKDPDYVIDEVMKTGKYVFKKDDLTVSEGTTAENLYDKQIPNLVNDNLKRYGGEITTVVLNTKLDERAIMELHREELPSWGDDLASAKDTNFKIPRKGTIFNQAVRDMVAYGGIIRPLTPLLPEPIEVSQEQQTMEEELRDLTSGVRDGIVSVDVVKPCFFEGDLSEVSGDVDLISQYYQLTQDWKAAIEASNVTQGYDVKIRELQQRLSARSKKEDKVTGKVTYVRKYNPERTFKRIAQLEADKQKVLQGLKLTKEDMARVNAIYSEEADALLEQMSPLIKEMVKKTPVDKTVDLLTKLQNNLWISKTTKENIQADEEEAKANVYADSEVNPVSSEIEANDLADVDSPETVTDIPLEDGESLVTEYNETLNETVISMVEVSGQNVENVNGAPVFLKGEYAFATDPDKKNEVKLVNKEQSVWMTKEDFREILKSNFVRIFQKRLADRKGTAINPAFVVQQMARAFYNMFKPLKNKPYDVSTQFKQPFPLKRLLESFQFIGEPDVFFDHMAAIFPELKTLLKGPQYPKETVTNILTDKRFRIVAEFIAKITLKDAADRMYQKALEDIKRTNPEAKGGTAEKLAREKVKFITWIMFRAGEEIRVPFGRNLKFPGLLFFERSDLGLKAPYATSANPVTPNGEMQAVVNDLITIHKMLRIPFTKTDVAQWAKERPALAFFRLLAHPALTNDDTYQRILVWAKTEADNPLLLDQITAGLFTHSDMFAMWMRGFQKRPWTKDEIQKAGGDPARLSVGSADVQSQKYRTNSEFAHQTKRQGLIPVDDWITSERTYIRDSLLLLAQVRLINRFKMLRNPNPVKLPGFEDNGEVSKYISLMKVVDYEISPVMKKISELTGLTPNDIFVKMGYIQGHNLPGFALYLKGTGDRFQPPYIQKDLYDVFAHAYAPKSGVISSLSGWVNTLAYIPRMILTLAPLDSPSRYLGPAFVRKPASIITTAADMMSKGLVGGPLLGFKILRGEHDPLDFYSTEHYENLEKFIANGFPRHVLDVIKGQYDIENMQNIIPELNTGWENIKEWAISMAGFNTAIFERIIMPKLYDVCNAEYKKLKSENYDDDTAARLATLKVTNLSFLLDSSIWGPEGASWAAILFSKGLTPGFVRMLMAAMYPILTLQIPGMPEKVRTPGKRAARYMFGYKGKPPASWFNAMTLGDIGPKDLERMAPDVLKYLFKMFLIYNLFFNLIQWAMSWKDPRSQNDKDPLSAWRFMFNNDWRHKFQARLPYKDINSRDTYIDSQYLVETALLGDLMLNAASKLMGKDTRWGKEPMDVLRNKLGLGVTLLATWVTKRDRQGKLIVTPGASKTVQRKQFNDWIMKEIRPFQTQKQPALTNKEYNDFFKVSEWFGVAYRSGEIFEEGYTNDEVENLRLGIANAEALRGFESGELENIPPDELFNLQSDWISEDSIKEAWIRKNFPVTKLRQDNQRALMIIEMMKSPPRKARLGKPEMMRLGKPEN